MVHFGHGGAPRPVYPYTQRKKTDPWYSGAARHGHGAAVTRASSMAQRKITQQKSNRAVSHIPSHYKITGTRARHTHMHPSDYRRANKKRQSPWRLDAEVGTEQIRGSFAEVGDTGSRCVSAQGLESCRGVAAFLRTGCRVAELGVRVDADVLVLLRPPSSPAPVGAAALDSERKKTGSPVSGKMRPAGGGLLAGSGAPPPREVRRLGRLLRSGVGLGRGDGAAALPREWWRRGWEGLAESCSYSRAAALVHARPSDGGKDAGMAGVALRARDLGLGVRAPAPGAGGSNRGSGRERERKKREGGTRHRREGWGKYIPTAGSRERKRERGSGGRSVAWLTGK